jgi:TfoX/Sxy family transcriptional regulator of competence genes
MAKKAASRIPADTLECYENVIATFPNVERKGAMMPYTSLHGHMFSFLTENGTLAIRLPSKEREAFLKKHKTTLCERHRTVMQEYVVVPDKLLKQTKELRKVFELSLSYIASLKPKPTTRKKGVAATKKKSAKKSAVTKAAARSGKKKK